DADARVIDRVDERLGPQRVGEQDRPVVLEPDEAVPGHHVRFVEREVERVDHRPEVEDADADEPWSDEEVAGQFLLSAQAESRPPSCRTGSYGWYTSSCRGRGRSTASPAAKPRTGPWGPATSGGCSVHP